MRSRALLAVAAVLAVFAAAAPGASGDGGGPSTILVGGKGVLAPDGDVRYVALTTGRQTFVLVVRVDGGQVVRWRLVRGYMGLPVVALDGTTEGVSRDGRTLVVAGTPELQDDRMVTRFAVIDTRTLRMRALTLPGSWSYDALSPDGSRLYLVEYLRPGPTVPYRVRVYDLAARRLVPKPIVDRREREAVMRGRPVTRVTSGRWAYTLYARARKEPFVHALDTVRSAAYCVDLPLELRLAQQLSLRLGLSGDRLAVRSDGRALVIVDTRTLAVAGG